MQSAFPRGAIKLKPAPGVRQFKEGSNEWYACRGRYDLAEQETGKSVLLRVAADSKYDLYLNGQLLVREGGLKRGPSPTGAYYDEIKLPGELLNTTNCLAILLWYFGRHGFSHRDGGEPSLLVQVTAGELSDWRMVRHPAYFDAGYVQNAYRLPENSVGFDARHDLLGWTKIDYDDLSWPKAQWERPSLGQAALPYEPRPFPLWFWSGPREYEAVLDEYNARTGQYLYRCRLPHNAQILPCIELTAKAGQRVSVISAQPTSCLSPVYLTKDGFQRHVFPGWINGEEVFYQLSGGIEGKPKLSYLETGYPSDFNGEFTSSDDELNELWLKSQRTLYVTMRDNFMDCPCRERAQWPGDMVVQLGQVPYCLDRKADALIRKALLETAQWQRESGVIYGPIPEGNWRMELPAQMLSLVSRFGAWTYYQNTADLATLEAFYETAKRYLAIWEDEEDGRIVYRPAKRGEIPANDNGLEKGTWDWIDWGQRIDAEPALNAWFALALEGAIFMGKELGDQHAAETYSERLGRLRQALRLSYWQADKGGFASADFPHLPDDRVQALMILSGVAEKQHFPQLLSRLEEVAEACPYMEKYVLESLFTMGYTNEALLRMRSRYRSMITDSSSTLWECWPEASPDNGTINHSWSGGPLTLLSGMVAGMRPQQPGWGEVLIQPRPGELDFVKCTVELPQGACRFILRRLSDEWGIELTLPEGCRALFDPLYLNSEEEPVHIETRTEPWCHTVPIKPNCSASWIRKMSVSS